MWNEISVVWYQLSVFSQIPSGNIDLAPTILHLLGIKPKQPMNGRVLREALVAESGPAPEVKERKLEARHRFGVLEWSQYLTIHEVDGAVYYTEGNGRMILAP